MKRVIVLSIATLFACTAAPFAHEADDPPAAAAAPVTTAAPLAARAADADSTPHIAGFRDEDVAAQLARETAAARVPQPDSLRRHLRILTEEPHIAGTRADSLTAVYVRDRLAAYGWDARIETIPVYLNWPKRASLTLLEPDSLPLALRETGLAWDKDGTAGEASIAFHGYGASGDVTAGVVYANYGEAADFRALAALGIDVRGRIVLVRYGRVFRGLKVRNAERLGAAAVVIYSDPADDGYARDDAYPRGQGRPADAIQRGSVQYLSEGPGDPTTPGWASVAGGKRLKPAETKGIPRIPSIPISWGEAQKILARLEGPKVPAGAQGGLPITYHVGPGPAKLRLAVEHDYAVRNIWNVIATLAGRETPTQKVICGNHRDAWTHGAVDPNSGTIAMLEMGRAIGALAKSGWRPRRTLVLASWDGEEYGLLGSTEHAEANVADYTANAVCYLNVDAAVSGKDLNAAGGHALRDVLGQAMQCVPDPGRNQSLWATAVDRAWNDQRAAWSRRNRERRWRNEPPRPFEWNVAPLGSGSDYTPFLDHLGVPSLDMSFGGLHGTYHSMYDSFEFVDRVVDPGYAYHMAMVDLWQRVALRIAEAEVIPLRYSTEATFALDELQSLMDRADDASVGRPDSMQFRANVIPAAQAAARWRNAALQLERRVEQMLQGAAPWPQGGAAPINAALIASERGLLGPGLPGRPWFRHELYAPGLDTGYAPVPMPRLGQAVLDGDGRAWARGLQPLIEAFDRAAAALAGLK